MLHPFPPSMYQDPFHCSSSSPDRFALAPYVVTRPNPYTVKSQNTQYYTPLRTTANLSSISSRSSSLGSANVDTASFQARLVDHAHSSLHAASKTARCSSKPQEPSHTSYPLLTMVKPKTRPVKALSLSVEQAAAKRISSTKLAPAAAGKLHKSISDAAKHRVRTSDNTAHSVASDSTIMEAERTRPETPSPLSSPSPPSPLQSRPRGKARLQVPRITIRSPTPEPEPAVEQLLQNDTPSRSNLTSPETPLYSSALLAWIKADISRVEDDIDAVLSKYLDLRQTPRLISIEFLRSLTSSICRLDSYVEDAHSALGLAKMRAISSHLFRHIVTGFFHLLEDPLAPYDTAAHLALVSAKIVQDFDKATELCCQLLGVHTQGKERFHHGRLFANVVHDELGKILDRGAALVDSNNRLSLPGEGGTVLDPPTLGAEGSSFAGGSQWKGRAELRKVWAQEGEERDQFVAIDVVRFLGELALHDVVEVEVLARWLDRFLTRTAYIDIPSEWEVECACALLVTVGSMLERKARPDPAASGGTGADKGKGRNVDSVEPPQISSGSDIQGDEVAMETLRKTMDRIDFLVTDAEISLAAREWLVEVQRLRERGWSRDEDVPSLDEPPNSD